MAPDEAAVKTEAGQKVVFSWYQEKEDTAYNAETDEVYIVTYCPEKDEYLIPDLDVTRGDGTYTLQLLPYHMGQLIHCYMNFVSLSGTVSNSVYIGEIVIE